MKARFQEVETGKVRSQEREAEKAFFQRKEQRSSRYWASTAWN